MSKSKKSTRDRYPGLAQEASELGYSYGHLWSVISGRRKSRSLMEKHAEYKRQQTEAFRAARVTANAPGVTTGVSGSPGLKEAATR